jgi:hypothetical protein
MLTFVEAISLAGDRRKQNDDACGVAGGDAAWVIDGATDLHGAPLTGSASDAGWIATALNDSLHAWIAAPEAGAVHFRGSEMSPEDWFRNLLELVVGDELLPRFQQLHQSAVERWQSPIASLLLVREIVEGVAGVDLGDCRVFAIGADGVVHIGGGPEDAAEAETRLAAQQTDAHKPLLRREGTIARLREQRAALNQPGAQWTFCLDPACADYARVWSFQLRRPAHVLLMTDGFSALVDRYRAYDAAGLMRAALEKGLHELGR